VAAKVSAVLARSGASGKQVGLIVALVAVLVALVILVAV
jgi:hypothetical protein